MPLINLTTQRYSRLQDAGSPLLRFRSGLPALFMDCREVLHLGPETTQEAVRVCLTEFGEHDINIPKLGIYITFTEVLTAAEEEEVRAHLKAVIPMWLKARWRPEPIPDHDVDVEWARIHGYMYRGGTVVNEW